MVVFPKAYRGYTRLYPQGFSVILSLICCLQVKAELARPLGPFGFKSIFSENEDAGLLIPQEDRAFSRGLNCYLIVA